MFFGTLGAVAVWVLAGQFRYRRQADYLRSLRIRLLEGLLTNRPLPELLTQLAESLEAVRPRWQVSIMELKAGRLYTLAAPSLPAFYNAAVDGLEAKAGCGSCGTAAATGEAVMVADVYHHPYWAPYLNIVRQVGFCACWSVPIKNSHGKVLGTFVVYYDQKRLPSLEEQALIEKFSHLAALAIEQTSAESYRRQATAVLEAMCEGIMITDLNGYIVAVNRAFCDITGYTEAEVLGKNPRLLRSGHQDRKFYQMMWQSLIKTGYWQGEVWNRRKTGEVYPQLLTINTVRDSAGQPTHYVALMHNLSQLKQSQARIDYLTHHDLLTALPNRLLLHLSLTQAIKRAQRHRYRVAALLLDLDRFNRINDGLNHAAGDELLVALVTRLKGKLRCEDLLGRLAGDEFLLVADQLPHPESAAHIAEHLLEALAWPFEIDGQEIYLSASIGISLYPDDAADAAELIQHAETAMRQAKREQGGDYRFYTSALTASAHRRLTLETKLRRALERGDFILHYQPLIELRRGQIQACEALVRWQDPEQGLIPPDQFFPWQKKAG